MPKRKSELHLRSTTKNRKVREEWDNMSRNQKRARIKQMLKRSAHVREEQKYPKRFIYLLLQDKVNIVNSSSTGDDVEDSEVFATPFLPPSSHTYQISSPLDREDEFELPTSSRARVCVRENPGRGRPRHRGKGRTRGRGRDDVAGRGGANEMVKMVEVIVTMMLLTTTSKDGEGLEVPADQVDVVVQTGEVVVGIIGEEVVVIHLMIIMTTNLNTEIGVDSGCTT